MIIRKIRLNNDNSLILRCQRHSSLSTSQFAVNVTVRCQRHSLLSTSQFAVNVTVRCQRWSREEVSYPPRSPTPASLPTLPPLSSSPLLLVGAVRVGQKMGGDGSASCGSRQQPQQNALYLTAKPPAAGRLPPPLHSVTSLLLELYHECVDNGG